MRHADLINQLRQQDPHETDEVCNLMGAAARALEDEHNFQRDVSRILKWCEAYIGKATADGFYGGCVVSGETCLEHIKNIREKL